MRYSIVVVFLVISFPLSAQLNRSPQAASYTSVGVYSKNFLNPFSGSSNQAALAGIHSPGAGVYSERRFMLKELSNYSAAIALPFSFGGFGISMQHFGSENFSYSQLGLGYGRRLSEQIDLGVQLNYNIIRIPGYGTGTAPNFELGTIWHISDKVHTGLHVYNPLGVKIGNNLQEKLAARYKAGIGYEASEQLILSAEIAKQEEDPANLSMSMQYGFAKQFYARAGLSGNPGSYFIGFGLQFNIARLDISTFYHPQLGITPSCMLLFDFSKPKQKPQG